MIHIIVDIRRMNSQAVYAQNTGMIILGGGVSKHHTCNANLMVSNLANKNLSVLILKYEYLFRMIIQYFFNKNIPII